jgi:hypothetical protein
MSANLLLIAMISICLGLLGAVFFVIRLQLRAKAIFLYGVPTTGRITAINSRQFKNNTIWTLAIEFTLPGQKEPIRFESRAAISGLFSPANKSFGALSEGHSIKIHYRRDSPAQAVVDGLASWIFQPNKPLEW